MFEHLNNMKQFSIFFTKRTLTYDEIHSPITIIMINDYVITFTQSKNRFWEFPHSIKYYFVQISKIYNIDESNFYKLINKIFLYN